MKERLPMLLWTMLLVVSAFGLYMVKYRVQAIQGEITEVNKQLEEEREGLHVVAAEWAYLTRPDRLQVLSNRLLKLKPAGVQQFSNVDAVPSRESVPTEMADHVVPAALTPDGGE